MGRARRDGFTYLGLVIFIAVLGLVGAAALKIDALMRRAAAEEELLEIGYQFTQALQSYAAATPKGQPQQPPSLKELLRDPRFPNVKRHLRKIFVDPVTGKAEWGILYLSGDKGVVGVYSLSNAPPLKIGNFDARFQNFDNKEKLSDWRFTLTGQAMAVTGAVSDMTPPPVPVVTPTTPVEPPKEGGDAQDGGKPPAPGDGGKPSAPPAPPPATPPAEPPAEAPAEPPAEPPVEPATDTPPAKPDDKGNTGDPAAPGKGTPLKPTR